MHVFNKLIVNSKFHKLTLGSTPKFCRKMAATFVDNPGISGDPSNFLHRISQHSSEVNEYSSESSSLLGISKSDDENLQMKSIFFLEINIAEVLAVFKIILG